MHVGIRGIQASAPGAASPQPLGRDIHSPLDCAKGGPTSLQHPHSNLYSSKFNSFHPAGEKLGLPNGPSLLPQRVHGPTIPTAAPASGELNMPAHFLQIIVHLNTVYQGGTMRTLLCSRTNSNFLLQLTDQATPLPCTAAQSTFLGPATTSKLQATTDGRRPVALSAWQGLRHVVHSPHPLFPVHLVSPTCNTLTQAPQLQPTRARGRPNPSSQLQPQRLQRRQQDVPSLPLAVAPTLRRIHHSQRRPCSSMV